MHYNILYKDIYYDNKKTTINWLVQYQGVYKYNRTNLQ